MPADAALQQRVMTRIDATDTVLREAERQEWATRLTGVTMISDGYLPFRDNIDVAYRYGVQQVVEPGGSTRTPEVQAACREYGVTLIHTGTRLFRH